MLEQQSKVGQQYNSIFISQETLVLLPGLKPAWYGWDHSPGGHFWTKGHKPKNKAESVNPKALPEAIRFLSHPRNPCQQLTIWSTHPGRLFLCCEAQLCTEQHQTSWKGSARKDKDKIVLDGAIPRWGRTGKVSDLLLHLSTSARILEDFPSRPVHSPGRHFFRLLDSNAAQSLPETWLWLWVKETQSYPR